MKRRIASIVATVVAAVALPAGASAQNLIGEPSSPENFGVASAGRNAHESPTAGAIVNSAPTPNTNTLTENIGGQTVNSSGILLHDGAAYIVHRLQTPLTLPDGSKVEPDGVVTQTDGSKKELRSDQMLTLDGKVKEAPFQAIETGQSNQKGAAAPASNANTPSTTPSSQAGPFPDEFPDDLDYPPEAAPQKEAPTPAPPSVNPQKNQSDDDIPD